MSALGEAAARVRGGGVVAFTGAGISAESGIPTFRDPGGIWDRFDPEEYGTWDGVMRLAMTRPDELADFLAELRRTMAAAEPGNAHRALVRLEEAGLLEAVITQNVDGLHQRAGSRVVLELHGSLSRVVCLVCGRRDTVDREDLLASLDRAIVGLRTAFVPSLASLLPLCSACGGPARPDFVAFTEPVQGLPAARSMARGCETLLVVGTHGEVYPAAEIPLVAREGGAAVVEVSTGRTFIDADTRVRGPAGRILPALVDLVLA